MARIKMDSLYPLLAVIILAAALSPMAAIAAMLFMPFALSLLAAHENKFVSTGFAAAAAILLMVRYELYNLLGAGILASTLAYAAVIYKDEVTGISFNRRLAAFFAVLLFGLATYLPWLRDYAGQDVIAGLADKLVHLLDTTSRRDELLARLYQSGIIGMPRQLFDEQSIYSGLMNGLGFSRTVLLPSVRKELLASLVTTLKFLLPTALAGFFTLYAGAGSLAMATIPVRTLRRRGIPLKGPLPFELWHMTGGLQALAYVMATGFIIPFFIPGRAPMMISAMMTTLFKVILVTQGLASIAFMQRKTGMPGARRKWIRIALVVLFYRIPMFIGMADHVLNLRGLRPKNKEDT